MATRKNNLKRARDDDNIRNQSKLSNEMGEEEQASISKYWLMKSEPNSRYVNGVDMKFSFDDLINSENKATCWDGVRNYEARKHIKCMKINEKAFFYHSNCKSPGIVGIVSICREAYVDHTQFDSTNAHYDAKSTKNDPKWWMVDVKFERKLKRFISLEELKAIHLTHKSLGKGELINLSLFTRSRLSIQPINEIEWNFIISLENNQITN